MHTPAIEALPVRRVEKIYLTAAIFFVALLLFSRQLCSETSAVRTLIDWRGLLAGTAVAALNLRWWAAIIGSAIRRAAAAPRPASSVVLLLAAAAKIAVVLAVVALSLLLPRPAVVSLFAGIIGYLLSGSFVLMVMGINPKN
jgi:hypothetical protein